MNLTPTPPAPTPGERLAFLDALRGLAALAVVLVHCAVLTRQTGATFMFSFVGQRGVQLFYIVSAFTIMMSLDARGRESRPTRAFFVRRFFRVAPLYYFAVVANLAYQGLAPRAEAPDGLEPYQVALGVVFLHGWSPTAINAVAIGGWSIAVEAMFYLVAPAIHACVRGWRSAAALLVGSVGLAYLAGRLAVSQLPPSPATDEYVGFLWFPVELPVFLMGVLVYIVWRQSAVPDGGDARLRKTLSASVVANACLLMYMRLPVQNARLYSTSVACALLVYGLSLHPWRLLVNPVTVYLGRVSYSIYLLHFFVIILAEKAIPELTPFGVSPAGRPVGLLVTFAVVAAVSVAVAEVSFRLIERPGMRVGRWLLRRT